MRACLPCLTYREDTEDEDELIKISQVPPNPVDTASQSQTGQTTTGDIETEEKVESNSEDAGSVSNGSMVFSQVRSVASPEYLRETQDYQVSDCKEMIDKLKKTFEGKKLGATIDRFEAPLRIIDQFVKGITVMVQSSDPIAQIIWGGFLIVFKNTVRFVDLTDTLLNCIVTLSKILERFEIYSKMYPTKRVKNSLGEVCACCVEFCAAASEILSRRSILNAFRLIWDPVDHKLKRLQEKIEESREHFKEEAALHHAIETREQTEQRTQRGPKLPCHSMSQANNLLFFKRPSIMRQIEDHLLPSSSSSPTGMRSFLLHGLGGSGKTQLATNFAYNHWSDYKVIIWAVADTEQGLAHHFLQAATALGLPQSGDANVVKRSVLNWLRDCEHEWLIIFDNVDSEQLLRQYWPNSANGSILITSRQREIATNLVGESCEVGSLTEEEGSSLIQLLLKGKVSDAQNRELTTEMATILCGLPLALAQMAGYVRKNQVSVKDFLRLYKNIDYARALFGSTTSLDHEQYQQTLKTVWRLSFAKLSIDARTLMGIAVFLHPDTIPDDLFRIEATPPNMPLPSALGILDGSRNMLSFNEVKSSLTQQFLMKYDSLELSLSIHRQVQQSALHELLDGEPENLRTALYGAARVLYHAYPRQSPLGEPIPNWPACQKYTIHVLYLLSLYTSEVKIKKQVDNSTSTLLTELFCDCGVYLWARGLFVDSERLARASIEVSERFLEPHDCLRAQPYTLLGCICLRSEGRSTEASEALEMALHIREENLRVVYHSSDPPLHVNVQLANAQNNLGIAAKQRGEFEAAARLHEKAIEIMKRRRDHCAGFLLGLSLHNMGKLRCLQGDIEQAVKFFGDCIEEMSVYKEDQEMKARQAVWLCSLAVAEATLARAEDAELHFTESLQTLRDVMGDSLDTGMTCLRFGSFRYGTGRFEEASILLQDARRIFDRKNEAGFNHQVFSENKLACALHWLGRTYTQLGNAQDAAEALERASELYREITGNQVSLDAMEALNEYEALVSDD